MSDNKDRFGEKLHDVEKAREDQWARDEDRRLLEKLRQRQVDELHCPKCNAILAPRMESGHAVFACPAGDGAWLDHEAVKHLGKG